VTTYAAEFGDWNAEAQEGEDQVRMLFAEERQWSDRLS